MSILHRRHRPDATPTAPDMLASADALLVREGVRERFRTRYETLVDLVGSGSASALAVSIITAVSGMAQVSPLAAAVAGVTATLAVKVRQYQTERLKVAVLDIPGGRALSEKLLGLLDYGPVATPKGAAWVVFDKPDSPPRVMSERDYYRYSRTVPSITEIDASEISLFVTRLTYGRSDSVLTGLPGLEAFNHLGARYAAEWHIDGEKVTQEAVIQARALRDPEPTYEEDAFEPRI